jgi:hypothetical protein
MLHSASVHIDVILLHTWGARYLNVADSGPLPRSDGCGFSSSRATAAANMPMADSAGGKLEWPGLPDTLSSRVAVPFSEMPTLTNSKLHVTYGEPAGMDFTKGDLQFYVTIFNRLIKNLYKFQTFYVWHKKQYNGDSRY